MNKTISLKDIATYSKTRISCANLSAESYIGTDNILQNKQGKEDSTYVPQSGQTTEYKNGDTLIANIRPYLKKIWFATNGGGSSADVLTIRKIRNDFDSKFIYYNLFKDDFFEYAMKGAKGTKMPRGDKLQIMDFKIANLPLDTQQKITNTLSALDEKIELNNSINNRLEKMARAIYDYWFIQFDFPDENKRPLLSRIFNWLKANKKMGVQYV